MLTSRGFPEMCDVARLIAEHASGLLGLRGIVAADCPGMRTPPASIYDRCGVHLPRAAALVSDVDLPRTGTAARCTLVPIGSNKSVSGS